MSARQGLLSVDRKTIDKYAGRDFHWKRKNRIDPGSQPYFRLFLLPALRYIMQRTTLKL